MEIKKIIGVKEKKSGMRSKKNCYLRTIYKIVRKEINLILKCGSKR